MNKIMVPTDGTDWHGMTAERLWASRLPSGKFRIENFPLYAYGLSYGDVVSVRPSEGNQLEFERVILTGGHSTYRVLLKPGMKPTDFMRFWPDLQELGCSYESSSDPEDVFAIDVPPESDVGLVYKILETGDQAGVWHLDEGNYEHNKP